MKFHCPHCNQLLEATDSMCGQAIKCPACSGDLRVPATVDSKTISQEARPDPRPKAITKSSNPGRNPETDPAVLQPTPPGRRAPGSVASLVLGILSITTAIIIGGIFFLMASLFGAPGDGEVLLFHLGSLVLGIISIAMAVKAKRTVQSAADHHYGGGMATAGMACSIVGIVIFLLFMFAILSEI
jgi:hypothetical protein